MNSLSNEDMFRIVLNVVGVSVVLIGLCIWVANIYVKCNRKKIYVACQSLLEPYRDTGVRLEAQLDTFKLYINTLGLKQTYKCSSSVVANAQNNVVKYLMKYANISNDMYCMEKIDFCTNYISCLNDFRFNMSSLSKEIKRNLPLFIKIFASKKTLPYIVCNVDKRFIKFKNPVFRFLYVSPAGKSRRCCDIKITEEVLCNVRNELSMKLSKTGHTKAQRSAMTSDLREAIKKRDNYTCCICGNSVLNEPNLLLEVDHIIPIAKGGKTEANNLQTLCWRCNREKSDK